VRSSPSIALDGTVYVGSDDHILYALNPDGTSKWTWNFTTGVASQAAIGADGAIYVAIRNRLVSFLPAGAMRWDLTLGSEWLTAPSIGADGTVYVGGSKFYAIGP
jgi:outer membrane protein assembly factor BamB